MTASKLILDGDYGIDDAMAALYLCHQPDVEILAVGTVHGNATADAAARNALSVLAIGGRQGVPVAVGAHRPLAQPVDISAMVHGDDGLGGRAPEAPPGTKPSRLPAALQIVRTVREHPGEATILATGPLTNLALALMLDPEIASMVQKVVIMGGTVDHPGNISPYAEANIAHDPEAAKLVFESAWPVTQVGLDVTMSAWIGDDELKRIEGSQTAAGRFCWDVLQHYLQFYSSRHSRPGCPLHDPSAALVAVDASLVAGGFAAPVDVELRSATNRGMLIVDRREFASVHHEPGQPHVQVVTELENERLIATFIDGLLADPPAPPQL